MKKAMKKLMAALLAVAMVCAMAIPAFAYNTWETEEDLNQLHGYSAFQILRVLLVRTMRRFPTLGGAAASLSLTSFWRS